MSKSALIPTNITQIKGKLSYSESLQAWNIIRFKKEFIKIFPKLKEKRSKFSYKLKHYREIREFKIAIKRAIKEENLPLLLWVFKEE